MLARGRAGAAAAARHAAGAGVAPRRRRVDAHAPGRGRGGGAGRGPRSAAGPGRDAGHAVPRPGQARHHPLRGRPRALARATRKPACRRPRACSTAGTSTRCSATTCAARSWPWSGTTSSRASFTTTASGCSDGAIRRLARQVRARPAVPRGARRLPGPRGRAGSSRSRWSGSASGARARRGRAPAPGAAAEGPRRAGPGPGTRSGGRTHRARRLRAPARRRGHQPRRGPRGSGRDDPKGFHDMSCSRPRTPHPVNQLQVLP